MSLRSILKDMADSALDAVMAAGVRATDMELANARAEGKCEGWLEGYVAGIDAADAACKRMHAPTTESFLAGVEDCRRRISTLRASVNMGKAGDA